MKPNTKTIAAVFGTIFICSTATAAYFLNGFMAERRMRESESQFTQSLEQPIRLTWSNNVTPTSGSVATLLQSAADDSVVFERLASLLTQSQLKDDPEVKNIAYRLDYKSAQIGYQIEKAAYARVAKNDKTSDISNDILIKSLRDVEDDIALLKNKFADFQKDSTASNVGSSDIPQITALLEKLTTRLKQYNVAIADLSTTAWNQGFLDQNSPAKDRSKFTGKTSESFERLKRIELIQIKSIVLLSDADTSGTQSDDQEQHHASILRLQLLSKAYQALLLPYFEQQLGRNTPPLIDMDRVNISNDLAEIDTKNISNQESHDTMANDAELADVAMELCEISRITVDDQQTTRDQLQISSLLGNPKNLIFLSREQYVRSAPDEKDNSGQQFSNAVDGFGQASFLSTQGKDASQMARVQESLVKVFSVPDLESITVEPDGKSLSIIIKTNIQDFKIRATIASSRESLSVDKSILQKSMPVVALQLTGDELTIVGVAMQGEKNAYAKTQIVVPIKFDGQSAQDWHTRLLKREADEKLAAEQKEKAIAKQTAEMNKEQDNKISRQQQRDLTQDPVYRYTNNLIAQLNTYPPCVMFARAMRDMASSQAPDEIRERQVDKIFDKIPDSCIRQ